MGSTTQSSFDDDQTDQAVDDVVANRDDELPFDQNEEGHKRHHIWAGTVTLLLVVIGIGAVPAGRYFVLNAAGVRASISIQVLDKSSQQPLQNVTITAQGVSARTDKAGKATLARIKLGPANLHIERQAFSPVTQDLTVGWGSNPQGELQLTPTGAQYAFQLTDYLSGKPVVRATATNGSDAAVADKNGRIVLTVDNPAAKLDVTITSPGYRTEQLTIDAVSKEIRPVLLAPARWQAFISRCAGTLDLYKMYADGQGEGLVLKGTGSEEENITLVPHPTDNVVAVVSTRDNKRDANGFLLSTLNLVNLSTNQTEEVASSEHIQPIGWIKSRLVYVRVSAGTGDNNPEHHRLVSYDYQTKDAQELAASNSFNDVLQAGDKIYYAPSAAAGKGGGLFRVDADGGNRQTILPTEVWNLFSTSYLHMIITGSGGNDWYDYNFAGDSPVKLDAAPTNLPSRTYVPSPDATKALWVDKRGSNGVLMLYDIKTDRDKVLTQTNGLDGPVKWLSDSTVVYRIQTAQETADYVFSLDGGSPKKIQDVANTTGISKWQHY